MTIVDVSPVVDKAHGVGRRNGGGAQTSPCASVHHAHAAGSAVSKLGIVQGKREGSASGPGEVVGVGKVLDEAAGALTVLPQSIKSPLQVEGQ